MNAQAPRPTMKERQRQLREDAILDAARALMASKGYAAMTLEEVIGEVGISKPTLYQHFVSKEELGVRVLLRAILDAQAYLSAIKSTLPPGEVLTAMIAWSFDRGYGPNSYCDFAGALPLFRHDTIRQAEGQLTSELVDVVSRGQAAGSVRNDVSAILIAQTLNGVLKNPAYQEQFRLGVLDLHALKAGVTKLLMG
jgi:AcrR family transcriptional regulator